MAPIHKVSNLVAKEKEEEWGSVSDALSGK